MVQELFQAYPFNPYRKAFKFHVRAKGMEFAPRRPFKLLRVFDNKHL
jgi:hypothetical protein